MALGILTKDEGPDGREGRLGGSGLEDVRSAGSGRNDGGDRLFEVDGEGSGLEDGRSAGSCRDGGDRLVEVDGGS